MAWYPNANKTIKGNSSGPHVGGPFKGVLHTTEGGSAAGAISAFKNNNSWPHFLVDYAGNVWQFIDSALGARALRNLAGGVQTNLDSVAQIEVVGFAGKPNEHPPAQLTALKALMRWIEQVQGVKPIGPGRPFATAYGQNNLRFTNQEWDNFGGWCFPAETLVLSDKGLVNISDIKIGDLVLTHLGRWRKVTATQSRSAPTVVLKGHGHYGLTTTAEHPFLASQQVPRLNKTLRSSVSNPEWIEARDMKNYYWHSPTIFPESMPPPCLAAKYAKNEFPLSEDLFWIVGRWLGDGTVDTKGKFQISCHREETEDICLKLSKIGSRFHVVQQASRPNSASVNFSALSLGNWVTEHFGKYSHSKSLPSWALGMPLEYRRALLDGYLSADGSTKGLPSNVVEYSSVSKKLAFGIKLLAQSLGASVTIFHDVRKSGSINGRSVNQRDRYRGRIIFKTNRWLSTYFTEATIASKVKSVSENEVMAVYNLSVEEDESYIADGIVVHNCGHCHCPENQHWDPGAIDLVSLLPLIPVPIEEAPVAVSVPRPQGGLIIVQGRDGGVFTYEGAPFYGSLPSIGVNSKAVDAAWTPSGFGYWILGADGAIFSFGDAQYKGGLNGSPDLGNRIPIGVVAKGAGYSIITQDPSGDTSPYDFYHFGI